MKISRFAVVAVSIAAVAVSAFAFAPSSSAGSNNPTDTQYTRMFLTPKNLPFRNVPGKFPVRNYFMEGTLPEPPLRTLIHAYVPEKFKFSLSSPGVSGPAWWVVGTSDGRSGLVNLSGQKLFVKYADEVRQQRHLYTNDLWNYMGKHPQMGLLTPNGTVVTMFPCEMRKSGMTCFPASAHTYQVPSSAPTGVTEVPLNMGLITVKPHS